MSEIGDYLNKIRLDQQISIRYLAKLTGISHSEINKIENGERANPSPLNLKAIATVLGINQIECFKKAGYIDEDVFENPLALVGDYSPDELEQIKSYAQFLHNNQNKPERDEIRTMDNGIKVASLFAGIGGICYGFKQAGANVIWANEIDKDACKTYRHNFGGDYLVEGDIKEVDPNDIPVLAIVDSELMAGMPASTAAATGLDALTHAMEGYITKSHWEMTDMFELKAMKLIYENLERAVNKDPNAIDQMALAQYIAGMGFSNVGLGIVHSMAHQLGAVYDTPHGVANALLLPYVLEWNGKVCPERYRDMGEAFGLDMKNLSDEEAVTKVVDAVRSLALRLNIPQRIREIGGKEKDINLLAEKALVDPCTGGNPRDVSLEDLKELFKKAF